MLTCLLGFVIGALVLYWGCAALSTLITMIVGPGDANGGDWDTLATENDTAYPGAAWVFTRPLPEDFDA